MKTMLSLLLVLVMCLPAWAINFDGANDYVEVTTVSALRPVNVTVSMWLKSDTATFNANGYALSQRSSNTEGYVLHPDSGTKTIRMYCFVGSFHNAAATPADITIWHHYAGTYDGETIRMYVDGSETANNTTPSGNITYGGTPQNLYIGSDGFDLATRNGDCQIDDVRVYNRALSAAEISALHSSTRQLARKRPRGRLASGLVSHWEFRDKPIGGQVTGSSGVRDTVGGNHGTGNGGTSIVYSEPARR